MQETKKGEEALFACVTSILINLYLSSMQVAYSTTKEYKEARRIRILQKLGCMPIPWVA